jgi:Zn-dependent M28 family amino/carboxypeptidase
MEEKDRWEIGLADRLKQHVSHLTQTIGERNFARPGALDRAAEYIENEWQNAQYDPLFQKFGLEPSLLSRWRARPHLGKNRLFFKNVIAQLPGQSNETIVIGAHYDTAFGTPGADDNASGIAVLLEVSRLLKMIETPLHKKITFAAFTNEEPPFSRTSAMGSAHFVKSAITKGEKISFMLCLEMLGFYTDQPRSQSYPLFLKYFYPDRGDFIAIVGNLRSHGYVKRIKQFFEKETKIAVESLSAPRFVRGVDFSDHMNFWTAGIPAVMLTDTAFFRNPHYHQPTDKIETLDFQKMAEVAKGAASFILEMAL